jgi:hypothetical protein
MQTCRKTSPLPQTTRTRSRRRSQLWKYLPSGGGAGSPCIFPVALAPLPQPAGSVSLFPAWQRLDRASADGGHAGGLWEGPAGLWKEGVAVSVFAITDDFKTAGDIFTALHGEVGSHDIKRTQREAQVLDLIDKAGLTEFSMLKIQRMMKIPYQQVYRTFLGYVSHGAKYSGLLEKCPALATLEKSVSSSDEAGGSVRRRMMTFTFNREVHSSWSQGGLV